MTNLRKAALLRNICLWLIVAFVNKFTVNINQTQTICDCAASARSPLGCGGRSTLLCTGFWVVFLCGRDLSSALTAAFLPSDSSPYSLRTPPS
jgi:hypothetical protein